MIKNNTQKGAVIILNTLLFFVISIAIIFAVVIPVITSWQVTKSFTKSKEAFLLASSASWEALYRLENGMALASSETLTLAQGTSIINVSDFSNDKTVSVTTDVDSYQRNYQIDLIQTAGVSFSYGLQAGQGGFVMYGSSGINGSAYSNGDIVGIGGPFITGTAISANIDDPVVSITNNRGTLTPPYELQFGGNATPQDVAQSFTVSTSTPISSVRIFIKKSGSRLMNNVIMRITSDNASKPSKTTITQGAISASTVTTSYGYLIIPLNDVVSLTPGVTYWIVFDTSTTGGQYYSLGANDATYLDGESRSGNWASNNGGTWSNVAPVGKDIYFDVYAGGSTGIISGVSVGSGGVGDAWAHEVKNSTVAGRIYCRTASGNNKVCNTSRPDPVQQAMPISDANIEAWKAEAAAGGATSTISLSGSEIKTIGSTKIDGNLTVGSGAILNIEGTIYVTGNVAISGDAVIRVTPSAGAVSSIIVTDGQVISRGKAQYQGSGTPGSYILVVTTSTCPMGPKCSGRSAVSMTGSTGAVVLNAQQGTIEFTGGARARQATGHTITMSGGTIVDYDTGLANMNFTSGPSGSWAIESWKEVE